MNLRPQYLSQQVLCQSYSFMFPMKSCDLTTDNRLVTGLRSRAATTWPPFCHYWFLHPHLTNGPGQSCIQMNEQRSFHPMVLAKPSPSFHEIGSSKVQWALDMRDGRHGLEHLQVVADASNFANTAPESILAAASATPARNSSARPTPPAPLPHSPQRSSRCGPGAPANT